MSDAHLTFELDNLLEAQDLDLEDVTDVDDLEDDSTGIVASYAPCESYLDGECLVFGAPCPVQGNEGSPRCLTSE